MLSYKKPNLAKPTKSEIELSEKILTEKNFFLFLEYPELLDKIFWSRIRFWTIDFKNHIITKRNSSLKIELKTINNTNDILGWLCHLNDCPTMVTDAEFRELVSIMSSIYGEELHKIAI